MPCRKNPCPRRKNPELLVLTNPAAKGLKEALKAYERFHWRGPATVEKVNLPDGVSARALVRIGEVDEIRYTTSEDSERTKVAKRWAHIFKRKPHLCTTPRGDVLIIFGGGLRVTPRGIEG